jgi:hypothetical protein
MATSSLEPALPPSELRISCLILAAALAAAPSSLHAQALPDTVTMAFELDTGRCDNVRAAIERTIRPMSWIIRPIARHRLLRTNRPPAHLTILIRPDSLVITFEGHPPIATSRDGTKAPWNSGVSRETYYVTSAMSGDTLHQVITASDGHRNDDFVFLDGGERLELHVVLEAEHLPGPLDYTLEFRRLH